MATPARATLIIVLVGSAAWLSAAESISRVDAIRDLDFLIRSIEKVHPDPYTARSLERTMAERDRVVDALPDSMTSEELWLKLAPFMAGYHDGHTFLFMPPHPGTPLYFPADIRWIDRMVIVSGVPPTGLSRGNQIVRVNGHDPVALLEEWEPHMNGELPALRRAKAAGTFRTLLYMRGIEGPYTLGIVDAEGTERQVTLDGVDLKALQNRTPAPREDLRGDVFGFRMVNGVGYMNWWSISAADLDKYKQDIARMVTMLNEQHATSLVVDVRNNSGGDFSWVVALLDHLAKHPYAIGSAEYKVVRRSNLPRVAKWLGMEFVLFPVGAWKYWPGRLIEYRPTKKPAGSARPFFSGNLCVLTGAVTFSAAVSFADIVQTFHLGTVIGEETGGTANMHGIPLLFTLPRSGLQGQVANGRFVRPNGDAASMGGVVPDIPVFVAVEDIRTGRDPVLERAMSCPAVP